MGHLVGIIQPEIINNKFYLVQVDAFWEDIPHYDCNSPFIETRRCCKGGEFINDWLNDGEECLDRPPIGYEMCADPIQPAPFWTAQRITHIFGPYDDPETCEEDL